MLLRRLRLAARAEDGAVTIPTVIWLPIFFLILFFGLEMMFISFRQVLLDHAVDVTTRELRLGTATLDTHDELKAAVCTAMHFVPDCEANMAVEVFPVDTDTWSLTNTNGILCTDSTSTEVLSPEINRGGSNQMVVLRACLKMPPLTTIDPLSRAMMTDASGRFALTSVTVFVNEPRATN